MRLASLAMPAKVLYHLTSRSRTPRSNRQLGGVLAAVAGAVNAGGCLALQRYTSHITGIVSSIADELVLGQRALALAGASALLAFILGAAGTALLVNWARRRRMRGDFALPLMFAAPPLLRDLCAARAAAMP
jgi:uncharacterized membrane protein YoaK (UPF0700 family)